MYDDVRGTEKPQAGSDPSVGALTLHQICTMRGRDDVPPTTLLLPFTTHRLVAAVLHVTIHGMTPFILVAALAASVSDSSACHPVDGLDPHTLLSRAAAVTGLTRSSGQVLRTTAFDVVQHPFESDRMYPPYLAEVTTRDIWFDPSSGAERIASRTTVGGYVFDPGTTAGDGLAFVRRR